MVFQNEAIQDKLVNNLVDNQIVLIIDNYEDITENNIVSESMVLKQSICDEEKIKYGGCIASEFSIKIMNTEDRVFTAEALKGKFVKVRFIQYYQTGEDLVISNDLYIKNDLVIGETVGLYVYDLFSGYIDSVVKSQEDENIFDVIAYDPIARLYNKKITGKLKKALKRDGTGNSFYELLALCLKSDWYSTSEGVYGAFPNTENCSNQPWAKDPSPITKGELLSNLCEIVGGFGYWRPKDGKVIFLSLKDSQTIKYAFFESLKCENRETDPFDSILFPMGTTATDEEKNSGLFTSGKILNEDDVDLDDYNYYDLSENVLAWDYKSDGTYYQYNRAAIFYETIMHSRTYIPYSAVVDGRPWLEVGDKVQFTIPKTNIYGEYVDSNNQPVESYDEAEKEIISSYAFARTLKGIKALTDEIEARGDI